VKSSETFNFFIFKIFMCFLFLLLFCDHPAGRTVAKRKKKLVFIPIVVTALEALGKKERQDETQLMVCHQS